MHRSLFAVLILTGLTGISLGQDAQQYTGEVSGTNVRVRTGPGLNHYEMIRLSAPARVTVVGRDQEGRWLQILPPEGTYSLIAKQFVQVEGNVGTISRSNVNVRAGSDLDTRAPEIAQRTLNQGDRVQIIGQTDEYYKITPPAGVTAWISADFVRPVGAVPASLPVTGPAPRPVATPTTTPSVGPRPTTRQVLSVDEYTRLRNAFQAAEDALEAEYAKPAAQRDFPRLLAQYRAIEVPPGHPLQPYVDYRIQFLELAIARGKAVVEAQQAFTQAQAVRRQYEEQLREIERAATASRPAPAGPMYAAEGVLRPSELFSTPKRWAVYDQAGQIIAWAQQGAPGVDLSRYEGQCVGLAGTREYNPRLKAYIVTVDRVDVLTPPPQPAAPVVPAVPVAPAMPEAPAAPAQPAVAPQSTPTPAAEPPAAATVTVTPGTAPAAALPAARLPELIPPGMRVYMVKETDQSFWTIARDQLGDGERWKEIAEANPGVSPTSLKPDQVLYLPEHRAVTTASAPAAASNPAPASRPAPRPAPTPATTGAATSRPAAQPGTVTTLPHTGLPMATSAPSTMPVNPAEFLN